MKTLKQLIIICIIYPASIQAQQLPRYSQYVLNEFLVNPSIAGVDGRTSLNFVGRKEWIGFAPNTPETYSLSTQTRILKSKSSIKSNAFGRVFKGGSKGRVGLGLNVFSDNNAAIKQTGIQLTYAYHLFIQNTQLSFGLSGTLQQYKISKDEARLKDQSDALYALLGRGTLIPDASFGVSLMDPKFHIGLSVSQLFQSKVKFSSSELIDSLSIKRHYFFLFSYRSEFIRNKKWEYEPSFVIRTNEHFRTLSDFTIKFFYDRTYWFGLSARTSGEAIILMGLKYNNCYFGYSFDYGFSRMARFSKGSHELTLSAKFGDGTRRYRWLERY